jgi:hypothetical protein
MIGDVDEPHAVTTTRVSKIAITRGITGASLCLAVPSVSAGEQGDRPELGPFWRPPVTHGRRSKGDDAADSERSGHTGRGGNGT